jgi:uncharacterized protein YvpB
MQQYWVWIVIGCLGANGIVAHGRDWRGTRFLGWTGLEGWQRSADITAGVASWTSPEIEPGLVWDELVMSWNVETPPGSGVKIEARAFVEGRPTKYFTLGLWSAVPALYPRESVTGQADGDGDVQTDTLVLRRQVERAQLRITMTGRSDGGRPRLKFVGVSFLDRGARAEALAPNRRAWGRVLAVPERSQVDYPGGEQAWCSPTCLSMVLAFWGKALSRTELDQDVPVVADGVFDRNWPGTGNWPFNTAYAGMRRGLRAYVARLTDVSELEDWVAQGVPVVVSVSYDLLRGRPQSRASGHLVVCVGFTETGRVVVNDPGTRVEVRRTFPRENLVRAWGHSRNTVYLVYPEAWQVPRDRFGHWYGQ